MVTPAQRKGRRAEVEAATRLADATGWPVRRRQQEGRADDTGDLEGVPYTCVQVTAIENLSSALSRKLPALADQQARARAPYGLLWVRRRGGRCIAVMSERQLAAMLTAAVAYLRLAEGATALGLYVPDEP